MKKAILITVLLTLTFCFFGCGGNDSDIISLVDDPEGYSKVELSEKELTCYSLGNIVKVYRNGEKYVIDVIGKNGYAGDVEIVVLIENGVISKIKPLKHNETEGKGTRAFDESYLNQFLLKDIKDADVLTGGGKPSDGIDILFVTEATYTSNAVLNAVNTLIVWYNL